MSKSSSKVVSHNRIDNVLFFGILRDLWYSGYIVLRVIQHSALPHAVAVPVWSHLAASLDLISVEKSDCRACYKRFQLHQIPDSLS